MHGTSGSCFTAVLERAKNAGVVYSIFGFDQQIPIFSDFCSKFEKTPDALPILSLISDSWEGCFLLSSWLGGCTSTP
jgi:hypothetical protein